MLSANITQRSGHAAQYFACCQYDVLLIAEHRCKPHMVGSMIKGLDRSGYVAHVGPAILTEAGGVSSGTLIAHKKGVHFNGLLSGDLCDPDVDLVVGPRPLCF